MFLKLIHTIHKIFHETIKQEKEMESLLRAIMVPNQISVYIAHCPRAKRKSLMRIAHKLACKGYRTEEILSRIKLVRDWNLAAKSNLKRAILGK